jgi:hypothetical protein
MAKRYKICSCCGAFAGYWHQWHNRDTGFGLCSSCVTWLKGRGYDDAELERLYGRPGVHYEAPETVVNDYQI